MKKTLLALGILLCVCLLFFWPIFKGFMPFPGDLLIDSNPYRSLSFMGYGPEAYPNKAQGRDVISEMYPWKYFTIQEWKNGRVPLWNPHNFSGNNHMQNLQSAVFNPFNLLFFLFPFTTGWSLFILIQPILASIFFYFFAKELKLSNFAAIVGSIGFAFSSYMTVWIEYGNIAATIAYLPLLLFFLHRFLEKQKIQYYIGFIVSAILMLLSGYIQGAFYSYLVAFLFVLYYFFASKKVPTGKIVIQLGALFIFPLLLTTFQFIPTAQLFLNSTRWPYAIGQLQDLLQPPWYWITIFASDFFGNPAGRNYYLPITYIERVAYIGIPLLLFAMIGIRKHRQFVVFFLFLAIFALILTTNLPGIAYIYTLPIPVINTTVPTRLLSIFMFAGVVLAAFGIDRFFKERKFPKKVSIFITLFYLLLWVGTFLAKRMYPQFALQISITQHNLILPSILAFFTIIVFFTAQKFVKVSQALLFLLVIIDLFYAFQKITPFAPPQSAYPQNPITSYMQKNAGINRYWGYGSGYIQPNFQTVDGTYSPEGDDPLHISNYGNLLASSSNGKIPSLPPRPDANLAQGFGTNGMKNPYRQTLLKLLGVKYIVQHDESITTNPDEQTFSPNTYHMVWNQSPWQIYENKKVLPRYFLVNSFLVAHGQDALNKLYAVDLSKTVILDTPPIVSVSRSATGTAMLVSYEPQRITFTTQTTGPMILFLSDTYTPSWKVTIDKKVGVMQLADFAFRGVLVPGGKHTVVMYYSGQYFFIGLVVTGISFILFLISLVLFKLYE